MSTNKRRRGSALLMVLWISAALAAIAFSLGMTIRGETDHTSTQLEEIKAYYLAVGGVERAGAEMLWTRMEYQPLPIKPGANFVDYTFPAGVARVEIIPETAKLNVNAVTPDQLQRLLQAIGLEGGRATEVAQAIMSRRSGLGGAGLPSFPGAPASIQEIEELLAVKGVTPDIFYGSYAPQMEGENGPLVRRSGLVDCLSVFGTTGPVDAGSADPAVLVALGMPPAAIPALIQFRNAAPLTQERMGQLMSLLGQAAGSVRVGGNSIYTFRATARGRLADGRLSDLKRTVAAQIKYMPQGFAPPIHALRWYDTSWSH
jgi:general secretion pathway protein K